MSSSTDRKMKVVVYLRQQAHILHAKALERLAQQVASHLGDPFEARVDAGPAVCLVSLHICLHPCLIKYILFNNPMRRSVCTAKPL